MARRWRLFHPGLEPATAGEERTLSTDEAHHVRRVLRLREGAAVALFDGKGLEWTATLSRVDRGAVVARLDAPCDEAVETRVPWTLYQALARGDRMDWVIQKATELGATRIVPFVAEHAEGKAPSANRRERWRRIAVEACKQSGRRRLPEIGHADALPAVERAGTAALLLHTAGAAPSPAALLAGGSVERVWIAVGPEGGFSESEVARALAGGWRAAGLGPRVLRTETAGLVAAAVALDFLGELGPSGPV